MKLAHLTDTHINFLIKNHVDTFGVKVRNIEFIENFCNKIISAGAEVVVVSGDITEAPYLEMDLRILSRALNGIPIYFVLGNHDFYFGSIQKTKELARNITLLNPNKIHWLGDGSVIKLTETSCLVGDDGWYDIRAGLGNNSRLQMSDFDLIDEFKYQHKDIQTEISRKLALESAKNLEITVRKAVNNYKTIYIATHVPPHINASLGPDGKKSNDHWAPYMVSEVIGDTLIQVAEEHKEKEFIFLVGHTHTPTEVKIWSNVTVRVGQADYGRIFGTIIEVN